MTRQRDKNQQFSPETFNFHKKNIQALSYSIFEQKWLTQCKHIRYITYVCQANNVR